MSGLRSILVVCGGTALLVVASCKPLPFENVANSEVKLISRVAEEDPVSLQALIQDRLWIVGRCVTIGATETKSGTTIWRAGYRVGDDARGRFVYHPDRKTRHRVGERVRFGGGYIETLDAKWVTEMVQGGSLQGCPGPFIFVDETNDE